MQSLAKTLVVIGVLLVLIGGIVWLMGKFGLPIGSLPGDLSYKSKKVWISFPIASMLLLSLFLTVLINLFLWIFRK